MVHRCAPGFKFLYQPFFRVVLGRMGAPTCTREATRSMMASANVPWLTVVPQGLSSYSKPSVDVP